MDIKIQLRVNGYCTDDGGRLALSRAEQRFEQCSCAAIFFDGGNRELLDSFIAAADSPRALIGRNRAGGVVMLFRVSGKTIGITSDLATADGEAISVKLSHTGVIDLGAFTWGKNRSPLEVERDRLPEITDDVCKAIIEIAFRSGCTWAPTAEEIEERKAFAERVEAYRSGKIKIETDDEREARIDADIVAANAHRGDLFASDGNGSTSIIAARNRHAARLAKQQAERDAALLADEDRSILEKVARGMMPDFLQRVIEARRRQTDAA